MVCQPLAVKWWLFEYLLKFGKSLEYLYIRLYNISKFRKYDVFDFCVFYYQRLLYTLKYATLSPE